MHNQTSANTFDDLLDMRRQPATTSAKHRKHHMPANSTTEETRRQSGKATQRQALYTQPQSRIKATTHYLQSRQAQTGTTYTLTDTVTANTSHTEKKTDKVISIVPATHQLANATQMHIQRFKADNTSPQNNRNVCAS